MARFISDPRQFGYTESLQNMSLRHQFLLIWQVLEWLFTSMTLMHTIRVLVPQGLISSPSRLTNHTVNANMAYATSRGIAGGLQHQYRFQQRPENLFRLPPTGRFHFHKDGWPIAS